MAAVMDAAGMTLRDYFAAKALPVAYQYVMVDKYHPESQFTHEGGQDDGSARPDLTSEMDWIAQKAYDMADAMLRMRLP
jgi:hypothetical protein